METVTATRPRVNDKSRARATSNKPSVLDSCAIRLSGSEADDVVEIKTVDENAMRRRVAGRYAGAGSSARLDEQPANIKVVQPRVRGVQQSTSLKMKVEDNDGTVASVTPLSRSLKASLPREYHDNWSHIAVPTFKTYVGETRIPWFITKKNLDSIMPALWKHATGGDWAGVEYNITESAKRIVCTMSIIAQFQRPTDCPSSLASAKAPGMEEQVRFRGMCARSRVF
jgi:hypothetical protein